MVVPPKSSKVYHCSIETNGDLGCFGDPPIFPESPMPYTQAPSYISHISVVYMVFVVQCQLPIMFALQAQRLRRCEQPMGNFGT